MMKKLTKGIEESKKEKERLAEEKEKLKGNFKEIEQKAFSVQKNYEKTEEVLFLVLLLFWLYKLYAYMVKFIKRDSKIYLFIVAYRKQW